jgi:hydroxyacylglutathione hydrolase
VKLYQTRVGPIATNCYILTDKNGNAAVVDPGDEAPKIIALLRQHDLTPRKILLTHGHFDHIGGVKGLVREYPEIEVCIGKNDVLMLNRGIAHLAWAAYLKAGDYADLRADLQVVQDDEIAVGELTFRVLDTPGHTRGGVCYLCGKYLFSGDTLFLREVGRTDLEGGDYPTLLGSLRRLNALPGDYTVLPGHDDPTTLDAERLHNPYMKEALA